LMFVAVRQTRGVERVFFLEEDGRLDSVPSGWTDVAEPDVFVAVAAGRSRFFRVGDLLGLAELIERSGRAIRRDPTDL
jgi:hypothetical protein